MKITTRTIYRILGKSRLHPFTEMHMNFAECQFENIGNAMPTPQDYKCDKGECKEALEWAELENPDLHVFMEKVHEHYDGDGLFINQFSVIEEEDEESNTEEASCD